VLIDGVDTSAMTRDQLEAFALRLKAEMDREREERNYFQLERDKIRTFWEITRQQLGEFWISLMGLLFLFQFRTMVVLKCVSWHSSKEHIFYLGIIKTIIAPFR